MKELTLMQLLVRLVEHYHQCKKIKTFKTEIADNSLLDIDDLKFKLRIVSPEWEYLKTSDITTYEFILTLKSLFHKKITNFKITPANNFKFSDSTGVEWKIKIIAILD